MEGFLFPLPKGDQADPDKPVEASGKKAAAG